MKYFTQLREELDIFFEDNLLEDEINEIVDLLVDCDDDLIEEVVDDLVTELTIKKGEKVDPSVRRQRRMDYRKNRAKKIMQMRKYRKTAGYKQLQRKSDRMAKQGKTATGRDIQVRYGSDAAQRMKDKKIQIQNNEYEPELNELTTQQRIKRSIIGKISARKAKIKRERSKNKPPTPEKVQKALEKALRQKALSIVDKSGVYIDATPGVKSNLEKKASALLSKKRATWLKKLKPEVKKKMKDAYRERMSSKNPELD